MHEAILEQREYRNRMDIPDNPKLPYPGDQDAIERTGKALNYTGPSMNPTLRAGDGMTVIPYGDSRIRVGDVVVFLSPEGDHYIVHRVLSVDSRGIRTIGDNNNNIDPWILTPGDIMGCVVSARRRDKDIIIHGGTRGKLLLSMLQKTKRAKWTIARVLRPAYHWFARTGIFRYILSPLIKTQILYFKRPNGVEIQLLIGQRLIARRLPDRDRWDIRRPFRLIVDEAALPSGPEDQKARKPGD